MDRENLGEALKRVFTRSILGGGGEREDCIAPIMLEESRLVATRFLQVGQDQGLTRDDMSPDVKILLPAALAIYRETIFRLSRQAVDEPTTLLIDEEVELLYEGYRQEHSDLLTSRRNSIEYLKSFMEKPIVEPYLAEAQKIATLRFALLYQFATDHD